MRDDRRETAYRERVFGERRALRAAFADPAERQRRVLARLLAANSRTEYGRRHDFGLVRTLDDWRKAVPVQDYAALGPWIERMAAGERDVLTADDPAVYFTSSGSTGDHKKIPVTPAFMREAFFPFFYAAWAPLIEHFPDVLERPDAVLNLKHDPVAAPPTTADGHAHVGASQVDFGALFGEPLSAEPGSSAPWAALPVPVDPGDHLEKTYLRLRLAVQSDVRCVIGINPAMVAALPYQLRLWWPRIVREVRDGTLGGHPHGSPDPRRAAELAGLADYHGTIRPAHVWPRMRAIFCWTSGTAALYLPRLREEFGAGVSVLPAPVAASEGPTAVALDRHGSAGSLVVTASVYEFVDADVPVTADVPTLGWDEVEAGRDYHVVFSHVGGLYRYTAGDVVRAVDHAEGVPRVEYAGRGTVSDAAGERLRDAQVVRALAAASRATGLATRGASCRVTPAGGTRGRDADDRADTVRGNAAGTPGYVFAISPETAWNADETSHFSRALEAGLTVGSPGYRTARAAGRLAACALLPLDPEAFQRDWQARVASGVRPAQVKDRVFRQDPGMWQRLTGETPVDATAGGGEQR